MGQVSLLDPALGRVALLGFREVPAPPDFRRNALAMTFAEIPAGTFTMGGSGSKEQSQHTVRVSAFFLGTTTVTQAECRAVLGNAPSHFKGDALPVEQVSWEEAQRFVSALNAQESDCSVWRGGDTPRRVLRGGSWDFYARNFRSSGRGGGGPSVRHDVLGFRVVCVPARTDAHWLFALWPFGALPKIENNPPPLSLKTPVRPTPKARGRITHEDRRFLPASWIGTAETERAEGRLVAA